MVRVKNKDEAQYGKVQGTGHLCGVQVFEVVTELAMVSPTGPSAAADVTANSQNLAQQLKDLLHKVCQSTATLFAPPAPTTALQLISSLQNAARCL